MSTEEDPYSKREQDFRFNELFARLDKQDQVMGLTYEQTKKTNGRVTGLEAKYVAIILFLTLAGGLLGFLIPYSLSVTKKDLEVSNEQSIQTAVSDAVPPAVTQAIAAIEKSYNIQVNNNP